MLILALETATRAGSVALWEDGAATGRVGDPSRTHGERLPGELIEFLAFEGRTLGAVARLAVVIGPGSFTGLRIGVAAVQGLALVRGLSVVPVRTLDAIAAAWALDRAATPSGEIGAHGPSLVVPCLDGQRGDVFYGVLDANSADPLDEARWIAEPSVGTPVTAAARIANLAAGRRVVVMGDGARRYADVFLQDVPHVEVGAPSMPLALAAVRIAARHEEWAVAPHALRPVYVRRPDAVLARERASRARPARTWVVRQVRGAEDLSAVEALQQQAFTNPWGADAIRWELEHTDVARLYAMNEPGRPPVAYCACWMVFDELHINSLAVDAEQRRQGLATRLLRDVLAEARAAGATSATLEVRASNTPARALYERLGFHVEGVRRDYYQDPREDALILWKRGLADA